MVQYKFRLLGQYFWVIIPVILLSHGHQQLIAQDDTLELILSIGSRERNSYHISLAVFIIIQFLSEALLSFSSISLEFIRGFYWLEPSVNLLPLLSTLPIAFHPSLGLQASFRWCPLHLSMSKFPFPPRYGSTKGAGIGEAWGLYSPSVTRLSVLDDHTPSVWCMWVLCTVVRTLAPPVLTLTLLVSPRSLQPVRSCWQFLLREPGHLQTPGQLGQVGLIGTLPWIRHIYQCQWYAAILERIAVRGTITINGISRDLAVVVTATACPTVECVPASLCPSQSDGSLHLDRT